MGRRARTTATRPTAGKAGPVAAEVRERWQRGDHEGAAALVTDEMVLATTLIETEEMVRARLAGLARRRREYRATVSRGCHARRQAGHPGPRYRAVNTANLCQMNLRSRV
jgi:hypothetical protein